MFPFSQGKGREPIGRRGRRERARERDCERREEEEEEEGGGWERGSSICSGTVKEKIQKNK